MDTKDLELYQEENLQNLKELQKGIKEVSEAVKSRSTTIKMLSVNEDETLKVEGRLEVNTEKEIEVTNLELVEKWLDRLGDTVTKAIQNNAHEPLKQVEVTNQPKPVEAMKISNLKDIGTYFANLEKTIKANQPVVNVEKSIVQFPTNAKDAIPVRLSDGKIFYNAILNAFANSYKRVGLLPFEFDDLQFTSADDNGNYQVGTLRLSGSTVATLALTYDASSNLTRITRTNA